jgi:dienelactone hydrolase
MCGRFPAGHLGVTDLQSKGTTMMHTFARRLALATATVGCAGLVLPSAAMAAAPARDMATPAGAYAAYNTSDRGRLVDSVHLGTLSAKDVRTALGDALFDSSTVRYGVETYRLIYRTVDAQGRPTTASGLLVLPRSGERRLRTVSFTHGTTSYRRDAPSMGGDDFHSSPAITYAAAGFAAVTPDYLGLGVGPGTHPWMDVPSETSASLDMLRAARPFASSTGRTLQRDVLATGFSQGASAALGLARALQDGADPWLRLRAVAPIGGAYAFRNAEIPALLNGELDPKLSVVYTTYLFVAFNRLHHLYGSQSEVFQAPYADRVEKLFDGTTPGEEMFNALPGHLDELLTARGFEMLRKPPTRFAAALRVADGTCTGWRPRVPMRLYVADADEQAATANTAHCQAAFRAAGADVPVVKLKKHQYYGSTHLGSAVTGTAEVVRWFSRLN